MKNNRKLAFIGLLAILSLSACNDKQAAPKEVVTEATNVAQTSTNSTKAKKTILFYGDSLTAGYGLDEKDAFPTLIQQRIDSLDLPYKVVNAGLSGETSAGGLGRIDWVLKQDVDLFVLELGANDMLRGLDIKSTEENLDAILKRVKAKNPETEIVIAGMQAAPNMGTDYIKRFNGIFSELAANYKGGMIPFLLDGVAGIDSLNLGDGKHPNALGQRVVVENVWEVLKDYL